MFPKLRLIARGNEVKVVGEITDIDAFLIQFKQLQHLIEKGRELNDSLLREVFAQETQASSVIDTKQDGDNHIILFGNSGKPIKARTANQIKQSPRLRK